MTAPTAGRVIPDTEPVVEEPEPLLSTHFCAKGYHGPCRGMVYNIGAQGMSMERCECTCHAGEPIRRQRTQWS